MSHSPAFATIRPRVLDVVRRLPAGRVTTYGAIAKHLNISARQSARVLATLNDDESAALPWHRVVGAGGHIRTEGHRQATRLRKEGVGVSARGKLLDFDVVFIEPRDCPED
jgi:methylated-DNA-protein-cysteine methyltransferase-like protein